MSIYAWKPVLRARIRAMPMMPMEPAKEVSRVRAFLVSRLLKFRPKAVKMDMEERPMFLWAASMLSPGT